MYPNLTQIAIRLPAETLALADQVAQRQRDRLGQRGRIYEAGRITRSTVLRAALETGLAATANEQIATAAAAAPKKSVRRKTR